MTAKYVTETYQEHYSWTNYTDPVGFSNGGACDLPEFVETPSGQKVRVYQIGGFVPPESVYLNDGEWRYHPRSKWYTHNATGVRAKESSYKSPNFDRSHGDRSTTLTVQIPIV